MNRNSQELRVEAIIANNMTNTIDITVPRPSEQQVFPLSPKISPNFSKKRFLQNIEFFHCKTQSAQEFSSAPTP
jgi:hypothetical protein